MALYENEIKLKGCVGKNAESFATKNQTQLFENTLKLRGFLGENAEVPSSDHITEDTCAILSYLRARTSCPRWNAV